MKNHFITTPGPTEINNSVLEAMNTKGTNPDLDSRFFDIYFDTVIKYNKIINSSNDSFIICGEAILGLEAACATFIEPGDNVLCISNGIFGDGFADFVKMYGGVPHMYRKSVDSGIDVTDLEAFIKNNSDKNFKLATLVHCETPSGITNNIKEICPLLKKHGIVSVVDSVSAIAGEELLCDEWDVDVLIGGTQKCLSAPVGLTLITISDDAWKLSDNRKTNIPGFYTNLTIWRGYYEKKWFPYSQPQQNIYGLAKAIDNVLSRDFVGIHKHFGTKVRESILGMGFELYAKDSFSNTVTTVLLPEGVDFKPLFDTLLEEHGIMIAGGFGFLDNKIFRIGHMGENCSDELMDKVLDAVKTIAPNK